MIIAITGLTGTGKNSLGELLAEELGYKLISPTFKDFAKREEISLMEFHKRAEKDENIDKKFDQLLKEKARGDCVVTTWLGPWILDPDIRIKLFAPEQTRAQRIAKRDKMELKEALKHLRERDGNNRRRYKKIYNINIDDNTIFDACLNSARYSPEQLLRIVRSIIGLELV